MLLCLQKGLVLNHTKKDINAFLLSTDVPTHTGDIEDIFDMYCTILNKEDLEDYIVKWNTRNKVFTNIK